jgi:hypothetical protein
MTFKGICPISSKVMISTGEVTHLITWTVMGHVTVRRFWLMNYVNINIYVTFSTGNFEIKSGEKHS